nr:response regulator [Ramlibacter albus]
MALTVLFTNIFSFIADARQRKEVEQRQRLDLIVRGTHSGTLEWHANGTYGFSRRLRQILGRGTYEDSRSWDFFDFVHPHDRERVQAAMHAQLRTKGKPRSVVHMPPDDFRLLHVSGATVWVHSEAIVVTDGRGRVREYIASFMDITERIEAQEQLLATHEEVRRQAAQLEAQNAQLREAVRIREDVERIARHDLKAPLASIAAVPRLLREARTPEEREQLLSMVERASMRVLSMVNLSLDLHRMEAGGYEVRAQAVDLVAIAHTVAQELRSQAQSKQVAIEVEAPVGAACALGEELLCYSILANLAKNALEASPDGEAVRIRVGVLQDSRVSVQVHNAGQVAAAVRTRFFEKYATFGKPAGTGLGAYSARLMARIQQGELEMATGEEGTTLLLTLPAAPAAAPMGASLLVPSRLPAFVAPELSAQGDAPVSAARAAASVLLVDDDPYNLLVLRTMLAHLPLRLAESVNGRAALDCVTRERPDVVFMDLQMPIMGGLETLGRLRQLQRERGDKPSVVVAFSARDDDVSRRQCAQAGFDHYLVKPAALEDLLRVLGLAPKPALDADVRAELPGFIASRRELLAALCEAARAGDGDETRRLAHKLAGSLRMYGFPQAADEARAVERAPADVSLQWLAARCDALRERFERDVVPAAA